MENISGINTLNKEEQSMADICAFLSAFMYLDTQDARYTGKKISDLVGDISNGIPEDTEFAAKANKKYFRAIQDAVLANPALGDIKIVSQSAVDNPNIPQFAPHMGFGPDLVVANAFQVNGDIVVAYRGTGHGKWIDNGQGLGEERTVMQEAATRYFDFVCEKVKQENPDKERDYYVTGHSKGGNEAQYVCMTADNNLKIKRCYEFDGQGFSPEAIAHFIKINGEKLFKEIASKITAICGSNDYVNPLGVQLVDPKNRFYLPTVNSVANVFIGNHDILYMLNQKYPNRLNFQHNEIGDAVSIKQGNLSKFAESLSNKIMSLNKEDRRDCGITIMGLFEIGSPTKGGTGNIKNPSIKNGLNFVVEGIPVVSESLLDREMIDATYGLCYRMIEEGQKENKFGKVLGAVGVGMLYAVGFVALNTVSAAIKNIHFFARLGKKAVNAIKKDVDERKQMISDLRNDLMNEIQNEAFVKINEKYDYPNIRISESLDMRGIVSQDYTELMTVIAATPEERRTYVDMITRIEDYHIVISHDDIVKEIASSSNLSEEDPEVHRRAMFIAVHKAVEYIKNGEHVILDLPQMYNPVTRNVINEEINKYLNGTKHMTTAVVVTPRQEDISEEAELLRTYPPTEKEYHFTLREDFDRCSHSINVEDKPLEPEYEEYIDELYETFGEAIGCLVKRPEDDMEDVEEDIVDLENNEYSITALGEQEVDEEEIDEFGDV